MSIVGAFIVPHPPLIVPEIGRGQEKLIQNTVDAYHEVAHRIEALKPDTIIIATPHGTIYSDYFHISPGLTGFGDFGAFGSPNVRVSVDYDQKLVQNICTIGRDKGIPVGTRGDRGQALDHGVLIPLYFIEQYYQDYQFVRLSVSGLPIATHYQFGQSVAMAVEKSEKRVVFIASGDLSHKLKEDGPYGFAAEGPVFDRAITTAMEQGDFARFLTFEDNFLEAAAECGLRAFAIMAGALDGRRVESKLLSYEGPFGVGYSVATFGVQGNRERRETASDETEQVVLARRSLEHYIKTGKYLKQSSELSAELLSEKAGVFVTLKLKGELRGCIGTIFPTRNCVADEIIYNAVSAGVSDPRFPSVTERELSDLVYSVDVLDEAENIDSLSLLDPKHYGVIVTAGGKKGLLLPNLEGIDSPKQQVEVALRKAGIYPDEEYKLARFRVVRYE